MPDDGEVVEVNGLTTRGLLALDIYRAARAEGKTSKEATAEVNRVLYPEEFKAASRIQHWCRGDCTPNCCERCGQWLCANSCAHWCKR